MNENYGISRHNLSSESWHKDHDKAAMQLFGFPTYKETKLCTSSFFTNVKIEKPRLDMVDGKITIKPLLLNEFEGMLITKYFIQSMSHRTKYSLQFSVSCYSIACHMHEWLPMWDKFRELFSVLPMLHDHCAKELPNFYIEKNYKT